MISSRWPRRGAQLSRAALQGLGWLAILTVTVAGLVAACTPTGTASGSPTGTAGPDASGSGSPGPKPTAWPTTTIEATIALGAAHNDFDAMVNDIGTAVTAGDPALVAVAMDDALEFLEGNQTNIPRLQAYDSTKPTGDRLAATYAGMIEGLKMVKAGLAAGDGEAVEEGFEVFSEANTEYLTVAPELVELATQAIFMKRVLLR
jgi:hypothetical protein